MATTIRTASHAPKAHSLLLQPVCLQAAVLRIANILLFLSDIAMIPLLALGGWDWGQALGGWGSRLHACAVRPLLDSKSLNPHLTLLPSVFVLRSLPGVLGSAVLYADPSRRTVGHKWSSNSSNSSLSCDCCNSGMQGARSSSSGLFLYLCSPNLCTSSFRPPLLAQCVHLQVISVALRAS